MNQCLKFRNGRTTSNLADTGWDAARSSHGGSTPEPVDDKGEEAVLKVCGVGTARLPGQSWAPNWMIGYLANVGTTRDRPGRRNPFCETGQARCRLKVTGWGGGLVVVRAHERCVHGEGGQQVSREDIGMPGVRG